MEKTDLLKEMTYQELMENLTDAWRLVNVPEEAHDNDGNRNHMSEEIFPELEAMGFPIPIPKHVQKKTGSPRKNHLSNLNAPGKPSEKNVDD